MAKETTTKNIEQELDNQDQAKELDLKAMWRQAFEEMNLDEREYYADNSRTLNQRAATLSYFLDEPFPVVRSFLRDIGYRSVRDLQSPDDARELFPVWNNSRKARMKKNALTSLMRMM